MNTRSSSNKEQIDKEYQAALQGKQTPQVGTPAFYTSTPKTSSGAVPKRLNLLDPTAPEFNLSKSDDSGDETYMTTGSDLEDKTFICDVKIKDPETMAQSNPFATLKYAVEAVPFFDGTNIPVSYFIEGCEEAKSMLPNEAESQFAKVIRTRIVGEARRTIKDQNFETVAALTKFLKQMYGGTKNVYQLQGELGNVYQKNEEDVVTYANRVKLLGKQILEAYRSSGLTEENIRASLEKDMNKCFIRGLKPEIEQRINRELGVKETVADALRIEQEIREITKLRNGSIDISQNKPSSSSLEVCQICLKTGHSAINCRKIAQQVNSLNNLGTEILICQICKKRGHSADKCRLRDPQTRRSVNIMQENVIKCQLCSKFGHNAKNCRLNNSNDRNVNYNNYNRNAIICQWCDRPGHSANNCWKKQNEQSNINNQYKITCQICNKIGHGAKNCRFNSDPNELYCNYCKEKGHLLEDCQLRIASNNRRKENSGNGDGPSRPGVPQGSAQNTRPLPAQKTA